MGFLDKEGLSHLWGKVRDTLAGKQDKLTPGNGVLIEGNTISTESCIVSLTAEEYNALPQDEKDRDDIYYAVEGAGGEFSGSASGGDNDVYSTEEIRIGTWIDGKPLYRKVVVTNSPGASDGVAFPADAEKDYVSIRGYLNAASGSRMFFNATEGGTYLNIYRHSDNSIHIQTTYSGYQNKETVLVLEYTKTTDEAVSK